MPLPCQPCSLPRMYRSRHQQESDDGSSRYGRHESHIWVTIGANVSNDVKHTKLCTQRFIHENVRQLRKQKWKEPRTKVRERLVLYDERGLIHESYLPLGRSPSSFLQRTVGTGSPRASHLNSTLWSTNTTWLPGRCTKLGRSTAQEKKGRDTSIKIKRLWYYAVHGLKIQIRKHIYGKQLSEQVWPRKCKPCCQPANPIIVSSSSDCLWVPHRFRCLYSAKCYEQSLSDWFVIDQCLSVRKKS